MGGLDHKAVGHPEARAGAPWESKTQTGCPSAGPVRPRPGAKLTSATRVNKPRGGQAADFFDDARPGRSGPRRLEVRRPEELASPAVSPDPCQAGVLLRPSRSAPAASSTREAAEIALVGHLSRDLAFRST